MKKDFLMLICVIFISLTLHGQYNTRQNNVWVFGGNGGLNFNTGTPVPIVTAINASEAAASVSDTSGNLLFYTDGTYVYDRTGNAMYSGAGIVPYETWSTTQGALIVPVIGSPTKYYLFSLEQADSGWAFTVGQLDYCIVDMSLRGGLGDVDSSTVGTIVDTGFSEKMIAIGGDSCNVWLVVHKKHSAKFFAYNINAAGISSTPVVSSIGTFSGSNCYSVGVIKVSPDRSKIVAQVSQYDTIGAQGTELYDFAPNTGIVANCRVLDSSSTQYGAEFSPNSTKLYAQAWNGPIVQYDVTLSTASAIRSTASTVASGAYWTDLKLGPDGKIYFCEEYTFTQLDCFTFPYSVGSSCDHVTAAIILPDSSDFGYGWPNVVVSPVIPNADGIITGHSSVIVGNCDTLSDSVSGGSWRSSSNAIATVNSSGVVTGVAPGSVVISYSIPYSCGTFVRTDTIIVLPSTYANQYVRSSFIDLFPNPVKGKLNVVWAGQGPGETTIQIFDCTGKCVYNNKLENMPDSGNLLFDLKNLESGVYVCNITWGAQKFTQEIVVDK